MTEKLDDYDIISAMKEWQLHDDYVLSNLCKMIINRELLKINVTNYRVDNLIVRKSISKLMIKENITKKEASYFVFKGKISNQAYQLDKENINILYKSGDIVDIVKASDQLNLKALSKPVTKYYICFPKD